MVILPREYAFDFLLFCSRNEKPCPVIDVSEPGVVSPPVAGSRGGHPDPRSEVPDLPPQGRAGRGGGRTSGACTPPTWSPSSWAAASPLEQDLLDHGIPGPAHRAGPERTDARRTGECRSACAPSAAPWW
ncbi:MAG: hypothetical protein MZU95_09220 [Desulfomicrobium escambiense]|nr:hypothetical protein [Desulfomicrobium escambiense]